MCKIGLLSRLKRSERGVAMVEFAIILPFQLAILLGMITYGTWLFLAHSVQQIANDGARAGIGGLNAGERATLIRTATTSALGRSDLLSLSAATVGVEDNGSSLSVTISYDSSQNSILRHSLVPPPPVQILRSATVRIGTF